jgi:hypothetical protein
MPKISKRRTLLVEPLARHQATMILTPQARKISFEDEAAMPSSSQLVHSSSSSSSSGSLPRTNHSLSSSKMLMRRPTPSVCLSQLAIDSCSSDDDSDSDTQCPSSPISTVISSGSDSPWGHFIDVIPSDDDDDRDDTSQSSSLCSTKRLSSSQHSYQPYTKKHNHHKRVATRKHAATRGFLPGFVLSIPRPATSTDLMGALQRMHV